jgi:pimeloyl-ACP methyl ester carboxylesterase
MAKFLKREGLPDLAYIKQEGDADKPTIVFLGGFRSDMEGTKAIFLEEQCKQAGYGYLRFDYRGHGISKGKFEEACIGEWLQDVLDILEACTSSPVILVGSSMGGWLSLLVALRGSIDVQAIIGLAAAPDFTTWMAREMTEAQKQEMNIHGYIEVPNEYSDEPYIITRKLIEDGRNHSLLEGKIDLDIPVRLIQGKKDSDVPWQVAEQIKQAISGKDVQIIYIEEADHRLSKPEELEILKRTLFDILS